MMQCRKFDIERINRYMDGELGRKEKEKIEEHFVDCEYCRSYLTDIKNSVSLIRNASIREEVPSEIWPGIAERLNRDKRRTLIMRWSFVPVAVTSVMLLFFSLPGKNSSSNEVNDFIRTQMTYMEGEGFINDWYLEDNSTDSDNYITVFLNEDI